MLLIKIYKFWFLTYSALYQNKSHELSDALWKILVTGYVGVLIGLAVSMQPVRCPESPESSVPSFPSIFPVLNNFIQVYLKKWYCTFSKYLCSLLW